MVARRRIAAVLAAAVLALATAGLARAARADDDAQIVVYNKGQTLHYDAEAGADLKEVILETYDCASGKLAKKETIETYYHLSDDKEIITPAAVCERCQRVFRIEKRDEKLFFGGVRETPLATGTIEAGTPPAAPPAPAPAPGPRAAPAPAPASPAGNGAAPPAGAPAGAPASTPAPPGAGTPVPAPLPVPSSDPPPPPAEEKPVVGAPAPPPRPLTLAERARKAARAIVAVDANRPDSAVVRNKIITDEFGTDLARFAAGDLEQIARAIASESALSVNQRYYALRSFGFAYYDRREWTKAVFFYDQCIALAPDNYSAYFQKAVALQRGGDAAPALRAYARALAANPQERIASYFVTYARKPEAESILGATRAGDLRRRIATVRAALAKNETDRARHEAAALHRTVEEWLGGVRPPPAPGEDPLAPSPEAAE